MICDYLCEHVECNKIRKNCLHPIEHRQFHDFQVSGDGHVVDLYGKCMDCLMYIPLTIRRSKELQQIYNEQRS